MRLLAVLALVALGFLASPGAGPLYGQQYGPPPHQFFGDAAAGSGILIEGNPAPDGTTVAALNEDELIVASVQISGGLWLLAIDPRSAQTVAFQVDDAAPSRPLAVESGHLTAVGLDVVGGATQIRFADLSQPGLVIRSWRWTPRVIGANATEDVSLDVEVSTAAAALSLELKSGEVVPLTPAGADRFTATLRADQMLDGYVLGEGHNFIGHLVVVESEFGRPAPLNMIVNVRDPGVPAPPIRALQPDVQISPHVLNLRDVTPDGVTQRLYELLHDQFDFLAVVHARNTGANRTYQGVRNDTEGIAITVFDEGGRSASLSRLQGIIDYPIDSFFDLGETAALHEIGHRWMNHWPIGDLAYGIMGFNVTGQGLTFPWALEEDEDGRFVLNFVGPATDYNDFELYLMGLLSADETGDHFEFVDQQRAAAQLDDGVLDGPVVPVSAATWIEQFGERQPPAGEAQTDFRIATVVLSEGELLTPEEMAFFDDMAARADARKPLPFRAGLANGTTHPFYVATGGRGTLSALVTPFAHDPAAALSAPTIESVEPDTVQIGDRRAIVVVRGQDFVQGAQVDVAAEGVTVRATKLVSDSRIEVDLELALDATIGAADVLLSNGDGVPTRLTDALRIEAARTVALVAGWNLIAWTGSAPVEEAIAPIAGVVDRVFGFDAQTQTFRLFTPNGPVALNTLTNLHPGDAVWVHTDRATHWRQPLAPVGIRDVPLSAGFNLVSWLGPSLTTPTDAAAGIVEALAGIWSWDPATSDFQVFSPGSPAAISDLSQLDFAEALWVQVRDAVTWSQPEALHAGDPNPNLAEVTRDGFVRLATGNSFDFSIGETSPYVVGGDLYVLLDDQIGFWANNVGQRGVVQLGDLGAVPLATVVIPSDGYTRFGVPIVEGDTYVALAQEGAEGHFGVFRVLKLGDGYVDLEFVYR